MGSEGRSVLSVAEVARRSWYAFKHYNSGSASDPMLSYMVGYRRGVADCLADQFQFGGWDTTTHRLVEVLEELIDQREAVRMVTEDVPRS